MKIKLVPCLFIGILLILASVVIRPDYFFPQEYRAIFNFFITKNIFEKNDFILYESAFPLWEKGYSERIPLEVHFTSGYSVMFEFVPNDKLPRNKSYSFVGVLSADFYSNDQHVGTSVFGPSEAHSFGNGEREAVYLNSFFLPYKDEYWRDLSVVLTVVEPETQLMHVKDSFVLRIKDGFDLKTWEE